MEVSQVSLNRHYNELRWVTQELQSWLGHTMGNAALASSLDECITRLNLAIFNLDRNTKKLTKSKEKKNV